MRSNGQGRRLTDSANAFVCSQAPDRLLRDQITYADRAAALGTRPSAAGGCGRLPRRALLAFGGPVFMLFMPVWSEPYVRTSTFEALASTAFSKRPRS